MWRGYRRDPIPPTFAPLTPYTFQHPCVVESHGFSYLTQRLAERLDHDFANSLILVVAVWWSIERQNLLLFRLQTSTHLCQLQNSLSLHSTEIWQSFTYLLCACWGAPRAILGYSSGFRPPNLPAFAWRATVDISAEVFSMNEPSA